MKDWISARASAWATRPRVRQRQRSSRRSLTPKPVDNRGVAVDKL